MSNPWLAHVKKTMKHMKGKKFGDVLKAAKKTYKKHGGSTSGNVAVPASPVGGRRRTRRHSRK